MAGPVGASKIETSAQIRHSAVVVVTIWFYWQRSKLIKSKNIENAGSYVSSAKCGQIAWCRKIEEMLWIVDRRLTSKRSQSAPEVLAGNLSRNYPLRRLLVHPPMAREP